MATKAEIKAEIQAKISITGQRLTTGLTTRDILDQIVDAMFDQFGQVFTTTVNIVANVDKVITIPSATYQGSIRTFNVWDSSGNEISQQIFIQKGTSGSDQTITLNTSKTKTSVEVNILMK